MAGYTQDGRPLLVKTPLGKDKLLLRGFSGTEGLSQLFRFQLDMLAEKQTEVPFDQLLGQKITIEFLLPNKQKRFLNGICSRVGQGSRVLFTDNKEHLTQYQAEIVPKFWFLTRIAQSRIFQHMSVPDILKKVLARPRRDVRDPGDLPSTRFLRAVPRDRLQLRQPPHGGGGHLLLLQAQRRRATRWWWPTRRHSHPGRARAASKLIYESTRAATRRRTGSTTGRRSRSCARASTRSGTTASSCRTSTWRPRRRSRTASRSGKVTHKLKVGGNDKLEIYD